MFTTLGYILWDYDKQDFKPNPVYFSDEEVESWRNPVLIWLTNMGDSAGYQEASSFQWNKEYIKGSPKATEAYSSEKLVSLGFFGVYKIAQ